jgi:hypothetical protein
VCAVHVVNVYIVCTRHTLIYEECMRSMYYLHLAHSAYNPCAMPDKYIVHLLYLVNIVRAHCLILIVCALTAVNILCARCVW